MAELVDARLFKATISNQHHVLHSRLPDKGPNVYGFRPVI